MFSKNNQLPAGQNKGQSSVEKSLHGLASMLALIAAFLCCPQIYAISTDPIYGYLQDSYGNDLVAELGVYVWTGISTIAVYHLCNAIIVLSALLIGQRLIFMFA